MQSAEERLQLERDLQKSFGEHRRLLLYDEAKANAKYADAYKHNADMIGGWIIARYGNEQPIYTLDRLRRAVSALHKSSPDLLRWVDGKKPKAMNPDGAVMVKESSKAGDVTNSQADLIERQESDRKAKVSASVLASAQSRCSNYDVQPHSVKFDRRKRFLTVFDRLKSSGISAEEVSKGVDVAILATEKGATAESVLNSVDDFINGLKNPKKKAVGPRVIGV